MRVIAVPTRLRAATLFMVLWIPVSAFETIVVARAPWWHLPYRSIEIWSLAIALICLPLAMWMANGKRWSLYLTGGFGFAWCLLSGWVALRMRHPGLGFFTLGLLAGWAALWAWLEHEMGRSFFDPRLRWYEGLPRPIPGLRCELREGEQKHELRVTRLDYDGAFVFTGPGEPPVRISPVREAQEAEIMFFFRDRQVACRGVPIRALDGDAGAGFQFRGMTPDARKELGDFVEILRGEGHA